MKRAVLAVVLPLALVGAVFVIFDPLTPLDKKVAVSITPDDSGCGRDYPVGVKLTNNSRETIERTAVSLVVREVGHSNDLERERLDTDKIMEPGEEYAMCVARPESVRGLPPYVPSTDTYTKYSPEQLEYSAEVIGAWTS